MRKITNSELTVLGLALAALGLRLWHINWGLPERMDLVPDEIDYVMTHALRLVRRIEDALAGRSAWDLKTLDPVFLNYPSFLMYSIAAIWLPLKHLLGTKAIWPAYLVGRAIVATWGALTVPMVYGLAKELRATTTGALFAAAATALMPLHIWQSHIAVTDVVMTFWTTAALWAAARLCRTQQWRDFLLAGACLGLATGSKYTAALVVIPIILGAVLGPGTIRRKITGLTGAGALSLTACFAVTPYSFIRLKDTLAAMSYERTHTHSLHYGFSVHAVGWQYHRWLYQLVAAAPFSLGIALWAAAVIAVLWVALHGDKPRWTLLAFCAVFYGVTGSWIFSPLRYYLPLLIGAVVFTGIWLGAWLEAQRSWQRWSARIIALVVIGYTAAFAISTTAVYGDDTRLQAGRWMERNTPPGSKVAIVGWSRYNGLPSKPVSFSFKGIKETDLVVRHHYYSFDLVQITSLEFMRHYRHGNVMFKIAYDQLRDPAGDHELVTRFESHFLNKKFYEKLDPMFGGYFVSPTIEFYRLKDPKAHT